MKTILAGTTVALVAIILICATIAIGTSSSMAAAQASPALQQNPTPRDLLCLAALNATGTAAASMRNETSGYSSNTTSMADNATAMSGENTTSTATTEDRLLRSVAMAKQYIGQACEALREGDTDQALGYLVVVEKQIYSIEGNLTSTDTAGNTTQSGQSQNQTGMGDPLAGLRELFGGE